MVWKFRYLTQDEVVEAGGLDMPAAIQDMDAMFHMLGTQGCILPTKVTLQLGGPETERTKGYINAMPGYMGGDYDMAGLKWVSVMPRNMADFGQPNSVALVVLNDPHKGFPVAVMDCTLIYAMRTGAVSGLVARHFAPPDARTVGLVGTDIQARTQLIALETTLPRLNSILVYNADGGQARAFCDDMAGRLKTPLQVSAAPEDLVARSDVLVSTIPNDMQIIRAGAVPKGILYLQIGGGTLCEYPAIRQFDKIVADNWLEIQHRGAITLARAKNQGVLTDDDIYADLNEVIVGSKAGRQTAAESIYFNQVGMGTEDIAVAARIFAKAEEKNIGLMLSLWGDPAFV